MEAYLMTMMENWPDVLKWTVTLVFYFIVFFYRAKIKDTVQTLSTVFKEKVEEMVSCDKSLRASMAEELLEAKSKYNDAIGEIEELKSRLNRAERALTELLADDSEVLIDGD